MGTGYVRNDTSNNISDLDVIDAADLDGEFDALVAAFHSSTGHTHDGTDAEGSAVTLLGPGQEFIADDSSLTPKADSTYSLGTTGVRWSAGFLDTLTLTNALAVGQGGTGATSASAARTNLGVAIGSDVQAFTTVLAGMTASYTSAEETKLSGIEASATADQTGAQIKTAYEGESDTNAYDDDAVSKLSGIEASADVTDTANVTAAGALMDSELQGLAAVKATTGTFLTADQTKLDSIEASADVTDTANVTSAGALMDSELEGLAAVKATTGTFLTADQTKLDGIESSATADQTGAQIKAAYEAESNAFTDTLFSKLGAIEASADVTDTANVTSAGALMDSEVTNLAQVKAFNEDDYATEAQGTTADAALPKSGGTMTGAISTNSTFDGRDVGTDGTKLDAIEASADVTDTANVTSAGALMDSELTDIASVKALDQGVATTDDPKFTAIELTAIAASKAITMVDGFIYRTSEDSDGGAWRNRTQGTSWYKETLNTATRGATRKFPSVAVIIAESDKVTIFDGDDPTMPMWMVFNDSAPSWLSGATNGCLSVKNGILAVGGKVTNQRLRLVFFLKDHCEDWATPDSGGGHRASVGNFLERNAQSSLGRTIDSTVGIVDRTINDVAMTVLPNAPVDPATGLQVPTIALATDGGVSVITDTGSVFDWYRSGGDTEFSHQVAFDENNSIFASWGTTNGQEHHLAYLDTIPSSDNSVMTNNYYSSVVGAEAFSSGGQGVISENARAFATKTGANPKLLLLGHNRLNTDASSVGGIAADYNTGYMVGDIQGAFLSSTDDTNLVGTELVTNGDFASNITGWLESGSGTLSFSSNTLKNVTTGNSDVYQTVSGLTVGKTYTVACTITGGSATNTLFAQTTGFVSIHSQVIVAGVNFLSFVATETSFNLVIRISSGQTVYLDDISTRLADPDRSVKAKGLATYGTVTKTAVATGSELMAYSGFSVNNYLEQPYNSDLDFGTGDFSIMGWVNMASAQNQVLINRNDSSRTNGFSLECRSDGTLLFQVADGSLYSTFSSDTYPTGVWVFVCATRTASGLTSSIYINGEPSGGGSFTSANISNSAATTMLGLRVDAASALANGSLTLFRISATAPSAEQIAKIYRDELPLFQENAACTLYGTSDAVTALAHDSVTGLLHAGTSAGRSTFSGLQRVSNTTTAVAVAIAASDDMIVEG